MVLEKEQDRIWEAHGNFFRLKHLRIGCGNLNNEQILMC